MPIEYQIDHDNRRVSAKAFGLLTEEEIFGYQRDAWSRADVVGYDELVDMTAVERMVPPSSAGIMQLASLAASMDAKVPGAKLAIVAPTDYIFGLGRMFAAHRDLESQSTKQVGVFRSMWDAFLWLGTKENVGGADDPRTHTRNDSST